MGKWPWHCTSTGQDSSNELNLEWICPVVAEFWHLQDQGALILTAAMGTPISPWWANDHRCTGQDSFNEFDFELISQWLLRFSICKVWAGRSNKWMDKRTNRQRAFHSHRENSPVTQTTPEPTLLCWSGWPREKLFPHPWSRCKPGLIVFIGPLRLYCSRDL